MSIHACIFDTETQLSADEVGGWSHIRDMRLSVGVVYDSITKSSIVYYEDDVPKMIDHLKSADLVVGYNSIGFDYEVLRHYTEDPLTTLPSFDIMKMVQTQLGFRLRLQNLAHETLHVDKSGEGTEALKWFKEGKLQQIADYCVQDVLITKDLFNFGAANKYLLYKDKVGNIVKIPFKFSMNSLHPVPSRV